jgi:hypothetical protein
MIIAKVKRNPIYRRVLCEHYYLYFDVGTIVKGGVTGKVASSATLSSVPSGKLLVMTGLKYSC